MKNNIIKDIFHNIRLLLIAALVTIVSVIIQNILGKPTFNSIILIFSIASILFSVLDVLFRILDAKSPTVSVAKLTAIIASVPIIVLSLLTIISAINGNEDFKSNTIKVDGVKAVIYENEEDAIKSPIKLDISKKHKFTHGWLPYVEHCILGPFSRENNGDIFNAIFPYGSEFKLNEPGIYTFYMQFAESAFFKNFDSQTRYYFSVKMVDADELEAVTEVPTDNTTSSESSTETITSAEATTESTENSTTEAIETTTSTISTETTTVITTTTVATEVVTSSNSTANAETTSSIEFGKIIIGNSLSNKNYTFSLYGNETDANEALNEAMGNDETYKFTVPKSLVNDFCLTAGHNNTTAKITLTIYSENADTSVVLNSKNNWSASLNLSEYRGETITIALNYTDNKGFTEGFKYLTLKVAAE